MFHDDDGSTILFIMSNSLNVTVGAAIFSGVCCSLTFLHFDGRPTELLLLAWHFSHNFYAVDQFFSFLPYPMALVQSNYNMHITPC